MLRSPERVPRSQESQNKAERNIASSTMALRRGIFDVTPRGDSYDFYEPQILAELKPRMITQSGVGRVSPTKNRNVKAKMNPINLLSLHPLRVVHGDIFSMGRDSTIAIEPASITMTTGLSRSINRICGGRPLEILREMVANPQPGQIFRVPTDGTVHKAVHFYIIPESGYATHDVARIVESYLTNASRHQEKSVLIPCIRYGEKKHSEAEVVHHTVRGVVGWLQKHPCPFEEIIFIDLNEPVAKMFVGEVSKQYGSDST